MEDETMANGIGGAIALLICVLTLSACETDDRHRRSGRHWGDRDFGHWNDRPRPRPMWPGCAGRPAMPPSPGCFPDFPRGPRGAN